MGVASLECEPGKHVKRNYEAPPGLRRSCQVGLLDEEEISTSLEPLRLRVLT